MNARTEPGLIEAAEHSAYMRERSETPHDTEQAIQHRKSRWLSKITATDVADEIADPMTCEALEIAMLAEDPVKVGRVIPAVRETYAMRLALRDICGDLASLPSVGLAAMAAVKGV